MSAICNPFIPHPQHALYLWSIPLFQPAFFFLLPCLTPLITYFTSGSHESVLPIVTRQRSPDRACLGSRAMKGHGWFVSHSCLKDMDNFIWPYSSSLFFFCLLLQVTALNKFSQGTLEFNGSMRLNKACVLATHSWILICLSPWPCHICCTHPP